MPSEASTLLKTVRTIEPSWGTRAVERRGSVLLAVLVVSMLGALLVVSLLYTVRVEYSASGAGQRTQQAWAAALSGVGRVAMLVSQAPFDPERWRNNPDELLAQRVASDGAEDWYFTVYAPEDEQGHGRGEGSLRYGASDEGARFNVHTLDLEFLQTIPGVTPEVAAALADYIDTDSEVSPDGAEQDYYSQQAFPYGIANAPLSSLDELLLVRGLDANRLHGEDANLNLRLDPDEDDGDETLPPDDADGELRPGLGQYLSVWANFCEVDANGRAKLTFDTSPEFVSSLGLSEEVGAFVACAQEKGTTFEHPADLLEQVCTPTSSEGEEQPAELPSEIGPAELAILLDRTKFHDEETLLGPHVNVLTASAAVLALVPGIDAAIAESIVQRRVNLDPEERQTTAWLLGSKLVDVETYRRIAPWLVSRSFQFRVRVIGYGIRSGVYRILEVIIDIGGAQPRLLYLRDLTRLGPSFPIVKTEEDLG
jgi:hypothetical protein